jgi:tetratricopeptide (TPR) repeat protein
LFLLLGMFGGGLWIWQSATHAKNLAARRQEVQAALAECQRLGDDAAAMPVTTPEQAEQARKKWRQVEEKADRLSQLGGERVGDTAVDPTASELGIKLSVHAAVEQERIERQRKDLLFFGRFEVVRLYGRTFWDEELTLRKMRAQFTALLSQVDQRLLAGDAEMAASFRKHPEPERRWRVQALEYAVAWLPDDALRRDIQASLEQLDDEGPWRRHVREALATGADGSVRHLIDEARERPDPCGALDFLGNTLNALNRKADAVEVYRQASRDHGDNFWINLELAYLCLERRDPLTGGRRGDPVGYCRAALAVRPNEPAVHVNLCAALLMARDLTGAIKEVRRASDLNADETVLAYHLATFNLALLHFTESEKLLREVVEKESQAGEAWLGLAMLFALEQRVDEAIDACGRAIKVSPRRAAGHNNLCLLLLQRFALDKAQTEAETALACEPTDPSAHLAMGRVRLEQGHFADALAAAQHAAELTGDNPKWASHLVRLQAQAEMGQSLERKLPDVLQGKSQAADDRELLQMAYLCVHYKRQYADGLKLYRAAFTKDPEGKSDAEEAHFLHAARAAVALSASNPSQRETLQTEALRWLEKEVARLRASAASKRPDDQFFFRRELDRLRSAPELAPVHDADALAKLPGGERADWQKLWIDVEKLWSNAAEQHLP